LAGTTAPVLPFKMLHKNLLWSPDNFAGGLSHFGKQGAFAAVLTDPIDKSFRARKSYFFFANRIVCLGTGIISEDKTHPMHTTIFQKRLSDVKEPIFIGNKKISAFPSEKTETTSGYHLIVDPQEVGYIVAPEQKLESLRRHQLSYGGDNDRERHGLGKEMEGDFAITWIDHGKEPKGGSYEYAVVINEDRKTLGKLTASMSTSKPMYKVLFQSDKAHVVKDAQTGITGYALFESGSVPIANSFIKAVDAPCIAMVDPAAQGKMLLSLTDPVIYFTGYTKGDYSTEFVTVILKGQWALADTYDYCKMVKSTPVETYLKFSFSKAESRSVELKKR
jgi:chondroitin-sulfate-ABC endolyase/exolyase